LSGLPSQAGSGLGALQICCAGGQQRGQSDQATELEPAGQPAARRSCLIRQGFIDDLGMYRIQVEERRVEQIAPAGQRLEDRKSEEHTSELQSRENLVCRLLLEK